jgi:hypothetical protein
LLERTVSGIRYEGKRRKNNPTGIESEPIKRVVNHWLPVKGTVLKAWPPKVTMMYWPLITTTWTRIKILLL